MLSSPVHTISSEMNRWGWCTVPDPFPPEDCTKALDLFASIVDTHDLQALEADTHRRDQLYQEGFSGYRHTAPDSLTGRPGKHSFLVRTPTRSRRLSNQIGLGSWGESPEVAELYEVCEDLMGGARRLARAVLFRLDQQRPGAGIQERHVVALDDAILLSDDLRLVLYDPSPPGTELAEPHTDRSSLSFVRQSGGLFVERWGTRIPIEIAAGELACFPGHRMTDPRVCPLADLPPTIHGATSTTPDRRGIITYQVHPLIAAGMA